MKVDVRETKKDRWGEWQSRVNVDLGNNWRLKFTVWKSSTGQVVEAQASMFRVSEHSESHTYGLTSDGSDDYRKVVVSKPCGRVTEKVVNEVMDAALLHLESVLDEVKAHYGERLNRPATAFPSEVGNG